MSSIKTFLGFIVIFYILFYVIGSIYLIMKHNGFRLFYNNLNRMFKYQGCIERLEYASFVMIVMSINILFGMILSILNNIPFIIEFLFSLLITLSTISVTTRRLHDLGYSGWLQIPIIIIESYTNSAGVGLVDNNFFGAVFLIFITIGFELFLMFTKGQKSDNQYGKEIK